MTDGIDRHKAWRMSGLCSSDLSSAYPNKAPVPGASEPSEMAQKTSKKLPLAAI